MKQIGRFKKVQMWLGSVVFWLGWPFIWAILHNSRRTRVLIKNGDKILLVRHTLSWRQWGLPGGGIRKGEDPLDTARREVQEELRLDIPRANFHNLGEEELSSYGIRSRTVFVLCDYSGDTSICHTGLEVAACRWVTVAEAKTLPIGLVVERMLELAGL